VEIKAGESMKLNDAYLKAFEFAKKKGWLKKHPELDNVYLSSYPKKMSAWKRFVRRPEAVLLRSTVFIIENDVPTAVYTSFSKFPNLHEVPEIRQTSKPVSVYHKLDGSFFVISFPKELDYRPLMRSKGAWDNFVVDFAKTAINNNKELFDQMVKRATDNGIETLMFELDCGFPHSKRHNTEFDNCTNPKLWLLGAVKEDGTLVEPLQLSHLGIDWPFVPKRFEFTSWDEIEQYVRMHDDIEGFVVWLNDSPINIDGIRPNPLVKVKSAWYFIKVSMDNSLATALQQFSKIEDDLDDSVPEHVSLKLLKSEIDATVSAIVENNLAHHFDIKHNKPNAIFYFIVSKLIKDCKFTEEDIDKALKRLERLKKRVNMLLTEKESSHKPSYDF